jgi:hypothetical protein
MTIITLCGGYKAVSEMTGRDETRVRRWTYPKERGGSDGLIPSDVQQRLMDAARARGLPLTPEHFFPRSGEAA